VGPHLSSYFFLSLFFLHRFFLLFFPQKVVAGVGGPAGYLSVLPVCRSVLKEGGPFWVPSATTKDIGHVLAKQKAFESLTPTPYPLPIKHPPCL